MALKKETEQLFIREWQVQDATQLKKVSSHVDMDSFSLDDIEKRIIEWTLTFGQTKMGFLPIFSKKNQSLIGIGGIKPLMMGKGEALRFEIICKVSEPEKNLSEALQVLIQYGFQDLGLQELICLHPVGAANLALKNAGMAHVKSLSVRSQMVDVFSVSAQ